MGVLMRGVDMPKNCEECNFKGECRDYWEKIREVYTRPSWCPLVEVVDRKIVGKHAGVIIIDEPNCSEKPNNCETCLYRSAPWDAPICDSCTMANSHYERDEFVKDTNVRSKDCETCKWGEWYRNGRDITTMDDECGGCCSWNSKWTPKDEPQTELWHYDEKDCTWYPYSHDCGTCKNSLGDWDGHSLACGRCCNTDYEFYEPKTEPQTDCAWMKGE